MMTFVQDLSSFIAVANDALFNDPLFNFEPSTPALLALKRFVRGTLRRVSLAVASLIVILNVFAPAAPAADTLPSQESLLRVVPVPTALSLSERSQAGLKSLSDPLRTKPLRTERPLQPHRLLHSALTSHRLTSARLSVPPQSSFSKVLPSRADLGVPVDAVVTIAEAQ